MKLTEKEKILYDNTLVLHFDSNIFLYKYIKKSNIRTIFKKSNNKIYIFLLKIFNKYLIPGYSIFFANWKNELKNNIRNVVIFDTGYRTSVLKYIKRKCKKCRVIVFCWNILNENSDILKDRKDIDVIYSFDPKDVKRYNLKFNNSFYTEDINLPTSQLKNDLFFLGQNKGREKRIEEFKKICEEQDIKYDFIIPKNRSEFVDYDTYLKLLNESKAILDLTQDGQSGLTVRVMECLFLKKKLITDNVLVKKYNFYDKSNIFVIGSDNMENLKKFIDEPYREISNDILEEYDYKKWCIRMIKE